MNKRTNLFIAFILLFQLIAAQNVANLSGNKSLPSSKKYLKNLASTDSKTYKYSVEDYFENPKMGALNLSPDGQYVSYRESNKKGRRAIYVKNIKTNAITKVVEETKELIKGYAWAYNNSILYIKDKGGDENYQLYAINIDGSNPKALTPYKTVQVKILKRLREQKDYMIISMNKDNPKVFEPYKINIVTGSLQKIFNNTETENPVMSYDFDKDGILRAYTRKVNGNMTQLWYRSTEKDSFELVVSTNWKSSFAIIEFNYNSNNKNEVFACSNLTSDKDQIIRYDLKEKKVLEVLYQNDTYDVSGLLLSKKRNYEIDAYQYTGEKSEIVPVSSLYQNIFAKVNQAGSKNSFTIAGRTDNDDKFLIYVYSDKIYGSYYLYDVDKDQLTKMYDLMPQLKEDDMAEIRPIKFKSRDGLILHGYLTIPKSDTNKKFPLIVNPHGGPYGERELWGFNIETQLFASRGYLTLQVDFRGSSGYGKQFCEAGYKQIGKKMLEDLEDGVNYVIDMGIADKNNIAIYGISYGGLATLGSLVKTPNLYKCGVDYCGVSNLFAFMSSIPPYWKSYLDVLYEQWYNPTIEEDKIQMTSYSPVLNTDKIIKPLFVIHGANDPRVNINQADEIVFKLRKKEIEVAYMVKYNEGHGFQHDDNRIDVYKTMLGFFSKYLK